MNTWNVSVPQVRVPLRPHGRIAREHQGQALLRSLAAFVRPLRPAPAAPVQYRNSPLRIDDQLAGLEQSLVVNAHSSEVAAPLLLASLSPCLYEFTTTTPRACP